MAPLQASCLALGALALGACQDLPDIQTGTCGNGVLEIGEDCEPNALTPTCGAADDVNACFYECEATVPCPDGYGCGADGRCRQAAGAFVAQPPVTLVVDDIATGDVDGDGFDDLIAASGTSLQVRFGSSAADLAVALDGQVSTPETSLAVGLVDDDAAADLLIATAPGVQTFLGHPTRTLDPFSYPIAQIDGGAAVALAVAVDADADDPVDDVLVAWGDEIGFAVSPAPNAVATLPDPDGPIVPNAALLAGPLAVARLSSTRLAPAFVDDSLELALGYPGASQVFLYRATAPPAAIAPLGAPIDVGSPLNPGSALLFGWFDADHCLDLVVHVVGGGGRLRILRGTPSGGACTGALGAPEDLLTLAGTTRLLAAADLDGDAVTDLVTSDGLLALSGAVPAASRTLASAGAPFEGAVVVDLNGDGAPDVAGFREGLPDVDVLINAGVAFNRFVVSTTEPVQRLAGGDFDGDLTPDLAIVELDSTVTPPLYTVSVSFGAFHGPPSARVVMDTFDGVNGLTGAHLTGSGTGLDATSDLVVLENVAGADRLDVTVLMGSGARAMTSPLTLVEGAAVESPQAIVLDQLDGDGGLDLFAVGDGGTAFVFTGDGEGGFTRHESAPWAADFAIADSLWASGDVDRDGIAEIAAAERHERGGGVTTKLLVFTPMVSALPGVTVFDELDGFAGAHAVLLRDLDGDDDVDLLVALDGASGGAGGLRVGWNRDGAIAPLASIEGGDGCIDAAVLQLDAEARPELAAICHTDGGAVVLRRFDAFEDETLVATDAPLGAATGGRRSRLLAADIDGDGLTDLVVTTKGGQTADVRVLLQSDVHDLE